MGKKPKVQTNVVMVGKGKTMRESIMAQNAMEATSNSKNTGMQARKSKDTVGNDFNRESRASNLRVGTTRTTTARRMRQIRKR
jgi:hypothetical protein